MQSYRMSPLTVQEVETLNLRETAQVLSALGALNCYPEKLIANLLPHVAAL